MNIHTDHHAFTSTTIKLTGTPAQSSVRPMPARLARTLAAVALTVALAACGSSGSDVETPTLGVGAPSLADIGSRTLVKDALAAPLVFTNSGGAPQAGAGGCTATGLPAGLVVGPTANGNSCMITGTPNTVTQNALTVTVTATNTVGNSAATVSVSIAITQPGQGAPSLADIGFRRLVKDALADPLVFTNTGGAPQAGATGCTATSLPAGLMVGPTANGNSCMITGTPNTVTQNAVTITVTATNTTGNSAATVALTVSQPIVIATSPAIVNIVVKQTYVFGVANAPITFTNNGLDVKATDGCTVSPALPASLGVAVFTDNGKMTCQITGAPAATAARKTHIVTATSANNETNTASVSIEIVQASSSLYTQVAVGRSSVCAITTLGELYCWGQGTDGRLGLGDTDDRSTPTRVGTATNWSQISVSSHACASNTDGELYCWGRGSSGQLGLGDGANRTTPTRVGTGTGWSQVGTGLNHTCAVLNRIRLFCWGSNSRGQLGVGLSDYTSRNTPTRVNFDAGWKQVDLGIGHTCAVRTPIVLVSCETIPPPQDLSGCITADEPRIRCWGEDQRNQLGQMVPHPPSPPFNPHFISSTVPVRIGTATNWAQASTGSAHSCGLNIDGEIHCWGWNLAGQLGLGDTVERNTHTRVGTATNWSQMDSGFAYTCAINTAGELYCWGAGANRQLGTATGVDIRTSPIRVGTATNWSQINLGDTHACAINTSKELYCWGEGLLSGTSDSGVPTRVVPAAN